MKPIEIKRIRVRNGALDLEVAVALDALRVNEEQAGLLLGILPNLARHVCVSDSIDGRFGTELVGTELPHLLEHLIIELQGQATGYHATGHTSWAAELGQTSPRGYALMRTTVGFANDFVALAAANEAISIIEWMKDPAFHPEPSIGEIVHRIAAI